MSLFGVNYLRSLTLDLYFFKYAPILVVFLLYFQYGVSSKVPLLLRVGSTRRHIALLCDFSREFWHHLKRAPRWHVSFTLVKSTQGSISIKDGIPTVLIWSNGSGRTVFGRPPLFLSIRVLQIVNYRPLQKSFCGEICSPHLLAMYLAIKSSWLKVIVKVCCLHFFPVTTAEL